MFATVKLRVIFKRNYLFKPLSSGFGWNRYEEDCKTEGGHLASIHSELEATIVIRNCHL